MAFLNTLQHMLRIGPNEKLGGVMWKVIEKLVHRASQLETVEDAQRLLNSSITHTFSCKNCSAETENKASVVNNELGLAAATNEAPLKATLGSLPPPTVLEVTPLPTSPAALGLPPPPPPDLGLLPPPPPLVPGPPPPPPPVPGIAPPPPPVPGLPPPPPPFVGGGPPVPPSNRANFLLPQQNTPKASRKLKTFNWTKIPQHKIMNKLNIWTIMANDRQYKCVEVIDFKGIEGLFSLQTANKISKDVVDGSGSSGKKEQKHIHLLDAQRSLKINIFLSQFKG